MYYYYYYYVTLPAYASTSIYLLKFTFGWGGGIFSLTASGSTYDGVPSKYLGSSLVIVMFVNSRV